jgi:hypothetical protein
MDDPITATVSANTAWRSQDGSFSYGYEDVIDVHEMHGDNWTGTVRSSGQRGSFPKAHVTEPVLTKVGSDVAEMKTQLDGYGVPTVNAQRCREHLLDEINRVATTDAAVMDGKDRQEWAKAYNREDKDNRNCEVSEKTDTLNTYMSKLEQEGSVCTAFRRRGQGAASKICFSKTVDVRKLEQYQLAATQNMDGATDGATYARTVYPDFFANLDQLLDGGGNGGLGDLLALGGGNGGLGGLEGIVLGGDPPAVAPIADNTQELALAQAAVAAAEAQAATAVQAAAEAEQGKAAAEQGKAAAEAQGRTLPTAAQLRVEEWRRLTVR